MSFRFLLSLCVALFSVLAPAFAENPHWIWHDNPGGKIQPGEVRYFRKSFSLGTLPTRADLSIACDDEALVYINGKQVAETKDYNKPAYENITSKLHKGENIIAVRGHNVASEVAGVLAMLELRYGKQKTDFVISDDSWISSEKEQSDWRNETFKERGWSRVRIVGKHGDQPWGEVFKMPRATPAEQLTVLPGFKAELVYSSELGEGSWICMTMDPRGRFIISPQADNQPLLRLTVSSSGEFRKVERIPAPLHQAMGLLYAHNSLYVNGHGPSGTGLYRLIDANHNDRFEPNEVHFLKRFEGEGEHGAHALALGPDDKIYVMNGNHTKVPKGLLTSSPHKNYQEDFMLTRQWDPRGHAVGILAPGGYVVRTDYEGRKWELMLAGFRNSYGFDFSPDGELFTFDSDMEWDWGLPWYRPTRVIHCVPAGEYGWRSGSAVWPEYYADSLPATVNIGIGSPTGMRFGAKSKFPERYRQALFIEDWSYGRIFAVHLTPQGASYSADYELFVKGKPLNVSAMQFGRDGALYFITGGRGTASGLYRVTYTGPSSREILSMSEDISGKEMSGKSSSECCDPMSSDQNRAIRRKLESFYGKKKPAVVNFAWPYLGNPDRFVSYAARIAIEWQDPNLWKKRALEETNTDAGLNALLALARCTPKDTQRDLLTALKKFPMDSLSLTQKLTKLRVIELSCIRQGKPETDLVKLGIEKLDRLYPADNEYLNRELCELLIFLEAPDVIAKTLTVLDKANTQEEQVHYAFELRNLTNGWTMEQRKHYFDWFRFAIAESKGESSFHQGSEYLVWTDQKKAAERHPADTLRWFTEAGRDYGDGASYPKYIAKIREEAIGTLSEPERIVLGSWLQDYNSLAEFKPLNERKFVQEWTLADIEPSLDTVAHGRNFENGKNAFHDAQCTLCHRFGNEGGSIGPELTAVSSKYSRHDIIESILDPSKVVSDQFENSIVTTKDGELQIGRIVDENDEKIVIQPNPLSPDRNEIKKSEIVERHPSKTSPMPEGLLNQFTKDDILDLLAYVDASGKEKAQNFKPVETAKKTSRTSE